MVHIMNDTPMVTMAATTWLAVSAEIINPSDTSVLANSTRPTYPV